MSSLYIHIPFCSTFCGYCDFYSVKKESVNDNYINNFLIKLISDIKYQIEYFNIKEIDTAYIGGGTPSILGEKISVLLNALNEIPSFSPVEFTVEVNPESLNKTFLNACLKGGVNRLSLGIQTFHEPSRDAVNRKGDANALLSGLSLVNRHFSGGKDGRSLSVDLITGLPYHNKNIVLDDINRLLDYKVDHVSLYSLSVENDTPLEAKLKTKTLSLPEEDVSDSLWLTGREALLKAGFDHYEVSNFALPGKKCLHNMRYWNMDGWLGAGPSASGTIINGEQAYLTRYTYLPDTDRYINEQLSMKNEKLVEIEELDKTMFLKECLLMGYRIKEGPDKKKFKNRFGISIEDCITQTLSSWKNKNIMLFLNSFLIEAFEEIDNNPRFLCV